jgi:hypothetical protein
MSWELDLPQGIGVEGPMANIKYVAVVKREDVETEAVESRRMPQNLAGTNRLMEEACEVPALAFMRALVRTLVVEEYPSFR